MMMGSIRVPRALAVRTAASGGGDGFIGVQATEGLELFLDFSTYLTIVQIDFELVFGFDAFIGHRGIFFRFDGFSISSAAAAAYGHLGSASLAGLHRARAYIPVFIYYLRIYIYSNKKKTARRRQGVGKNKKSRPVLWRSRTAPPGRLRTGAKGLRRCNFAGARRRKAVAH